MEVRGRNPRNDRRFRPDALTDGGDGAEPGGTEGTGTRRAAAGRGRPVGARRSADRPPARRAVRRHPAGPPVRRGPGGPRQGRRPAGTDPPGPPHRPRRRGRAAGPAAADRRGLGRPGRPPRHGARPAAHLLRQHPPLQGGHARELPPGRRHRGPPPGRPHPRRGRTAHRAALVRLRGTRRPALLPAGRARPARPGGRDLGRPARRQRRGTDRRALRGTHAGGRRGPADRPPGPDAPGPVLRPRAARRTRPEPGDHRPRPQRLPALPAEDLPGARHQPRPLDPRRAPRALPHRTRRPPPGPPAGRPDRRTRRPLRRFALQPPLPRPVRHHPREFRKERDVR